MFGMFRRGEAEELRVVDGRVFVLGLDGMTRAVLASHEKDKLLRCAIEVARALRVTPHTGPIEGSYAEDQRRSHYFALVRALQQQNVEREREAAGMPEYQRLLAVTSSRVFGEAEREGRLLPMGRDSLTKAMESTRWQVADLTAAAASAAERDDDISLVGVAARTKDPVSLAAVRETSVLYAKPGFSGVPKPFAYVWNVDPAVSAVARRFLKEFRLLFGDVLPDPEASQARSYFEAYLANRVVGRCVRIGWDGQRHYHWAISAEGGDLRVQEFWDREPWTTERFRASPR